MKKQPVQEHYLNSYFRKKSSSKSQILKQYQGFLDKQRVNKRVSRQQSPQQKTVVGSHDNSPDQRMSPQFNSIKMKTLKYQSSTSPHQYVSNQRDHQHVKPKPNNGVSILKTHDQYKKSKVTIKLSASQSKERHHTLESDPQYENYSPLFAHQSITQNSFSSLNIFSDSTKQLEELQHNSTYRQTKPELHKGIIDILSLIKKEKQVIMNDMKHITKQKHKYKSQYDELKAELKEVKNMNVSEDDNDSHNETYSKMIHLLNSMDIDYRQVLPDVNLNLHIDFNRTPIQKDEIIRLQKNIIKKQVLMIENSRQVNQLLLDKIKES